MAGDDFEDDDYVANLLRKDAKNAAKQYELVGMGAFMPQRKKTNALKPNTRFLRNILRETDSHNAALLAKEAEESKARLREMNGDRRLPESRGSLRLEPHKSMRTEERPAKRRRYDTEDDDERDRRRRKREGEDRDTRDHTSRRDSDRHRDKERRRRKDYDIGEDEEARRRKRARRRHDRERRRDYTDEEEDTRPSRRKDKSRREHRRERSYSRSRSGSRSRSSSPHSRRHKSSRDKERRDRSSRQGTSSPRPRRPSPARKNKQNDRHHHSRAPDYDSDPLESIVGPLPPPLQPTVRSKGRGARKANSTAMDARFASTYDPSADVRLESDAEDDWSEALEALRDRESFKRQGGDRLRAAGFSEEQVKRWEKGGEKNEEDVVWAKRGEGREWDRGKVVDDDGVDLRADWGRLV